MVFVDASCIYIEVYRLCCTVEKKVFCACAASTFVAYIIKETRSITITCAEQLECHWRAYTLFIDLFNLFISHTLKAQGRYRVADNKICCLMPSRRVAVHESIVNLMQVHECRPVWCNCGRAQWREDLHKFLCSRPPSALCAHSRWHWHGSCTPTADSKGTARSRRARLGSCHADTTTTREDSAAKAGQASVEHQIPQRTAI